ncbi:hypothetical protein ABFS82_02G020600 [Erythranthe guttata]|uniref:histidinol-phosphatase n=1 Tax=Erythranthe guttata TaxID=4155 RepID=A0A022RFZ4_ERYGU|nr:PREDICTED: bifunctional phosphatase IMPL2, chloroplastic [Erythranthe guttata]EYU37825.1 hypothetical protein MIMGU_mgv1a009164mg [Erythranthe guttata]|eukprot:XP_012837073.1 PREDICTED: bifunctional phosphatase IMPL2, chloroplastic [Erythranthe guttata]
MQAPLLQMHAHFSHSNFLSLNPRRTPAVSSPPAFPQFLFSDRSSFNSALTFGSIQLNSVKMTSVNSSLSNGNSCGNQAIALGLDSVELDRFADVGNQLADAAGDVIRRYFRKSFDILDKEDLSPVTIADQAAEESMVKIIEENFPSHAIFGEENGWKCKEDFADFVWVLDPIDGTKSFITGKPLFGTLIALLHKGKPILGIIDQPVLRERWIGISGKRTTLNGQEIYTRNCSQLSKAYLYTTSPHLFSGEAEVAFARVRSKVKVPLYGCDCYAYALLASGHVDLVVESGLKPYDFLSLIPVIEGAGGVITDWKGHQLYWEASSKAEATSFNVVAAGDKGVHQEALDSLQWQ